MGRKRLFNDREKRCPGCQAWLPLERFGNCKSHPSGKRGRCKACFREQNAPHARKWLYGLDDEGLIALWERQGKSCAICREPLVLHKRYSVHVDRDRATRKVRGLLCRKCEHGLRGFQVNQALIAEGIKYLRKFERSMKCSSPA